MDKPRASQVRTRRKPALADITAGYGGKEMPIPQYVGLTSIFCALAAGVLGVAAVMPKRKTDMLGWTDLVLMGVATHKLSRMITKDRVTSPFRAPFTKYVGRGGPGEVEEESRGTGARKAIGDLVTCPYCMTPWVGIFLSFGLLRVPRLTRLVCSFFSSVAVAHLLHKVDAITEKAAE